MEIQGRLALSGRRRNQPGPTLVISMLLAGLGVTASRAAPAHADGAFPAAQAILLPRDRPNEIVLATTFGLLVTEDDGATWQYVCEADAVFNGRLYIAGPPPDDRIYAVSDPGAPVTADGACTWTLGGGALADAQSVGDVFPDPSDASRVFALARPASAINPDVSNSLAATSVYRSMDRGLTYADPIFSASVGSQLTGIEVATAVSTRVYLTYFDVTGNRMVGFVNHPRLARSVDGGDNWTTMDLEPSFGTVEPRLAAVDPVDSERVYLLLTSAPTDPKPFQELAITTDGGVTWSVPLRVEGAGAALAGFVRLPDNTLIAVGLLAGSMPNTPIPTAFRSIDAGKTFVSQPLPFHPVGLAQRDSTLFVSTNNFVDGYALASSEDGGLSWRPRLKFRDVAGIKACVFSSMCQKACDFLAGETLWPPETCSRSVGAGDGDTGSFDASSLDAASERLASGSGCGCGLAVGEAKNRPAADALAACLFAGMLGRRRRLGSKRAPMSINIR